MKQKDTSPLAALLPLAKPFQQARHQQRVALPRVHPRGHEVKALIQGSGSLALLSSFFDSFRLPWMGIYGYLSLPYLEDGENQLTLLTFLRPFACVACFDCERLRSALAPCFVFKCL